MGGSRHGMLAQGNENLAACSLDGGPCHGARARLLAFAGARRLHARASLRARHSGLGNMC